MASCGAGREVKKRCPDFTYGEYQQLVRNAEKLGGYYEMPMAIIVGIVMTANAVVRFVCVAMKIAVPTVLEVMMVPMMFPGRFFVECAGFDMDMGNVVSRMAMPQGGAKPRYRSRVEQQQIRRIGSMERSLPAKNLSLQRSHPGLPNDCPADLGEATDAPESTEHGDADATARVIDTGAASGGSALRDNEREKAIGSLLGRKSGTRRLMASAPYGHVSERPPSEAQVALAILLSEARRSFK